MVNMRAKEAERAAQIFQKRKEQHSEIAESDDMFFDAKEYHTSNKQIANILSTNTAGSPGLESGTTTSQAAASAVTVTNAKWGDEDDLDIDDDLLDVETTADQGAITSGVEEPSDIFVPPSQGADPLLQAVKKHPLIAPLYVATGDFGKALELLRKQLAVGNFEPLKQLFVDTHTLTKMKIQTLPHTNPLNY